MKSHPHGYSMKSRFNEKPLQWKAASMKSRFNEKPLHHKKYYSSGFWVYRFLWRWKENCGEKSFQFYSHFFRNKVSCGNTAFDRITLASLAFGRHLTEWHLGIVKVYQQIEFQENDTQQNNIWQKGAQQNDIRQRGIQKSVIWQIFTQTFGRKKCH